MSIKTFIQWCEENQIDLPLDVEKGEQTTDENKNRTGLGLYPDAYHKAQYPDNYHTPSKATAALDLQNMKTQKKDRKG